MRFVDIQKMAVHALGKNKIQTALTMLGIVIGVMTAIVIASILTGMRQNIVAIIEEYGTNNIYAFHLSTGPRVGEDRAERLRKPLTVADGEAIAAQGISGVEDLDRLDDCRFGGMVAAVLVTGVEV